MVYGSPAGNIYRSDDIGISGESARCTGEKRLRLTIRFRNETTYRTGAGGISWVNQAYENTGEFRLVFDKLPQLVESPGVMLSPLTFTNRDAVSYSLEVFQGNAPTAVFGLRNNTLGNHVVDVGSKASLFFTALLEKSFRRLRIFGLKFGSKFGMSLSQPVNLSPRVNLPIGISGDVNDTKVNSKKLGRVTFRRFLNFTGLEEVEVAVPINQVGFPTEMAEHFQLPVSGSKRNLQPAIKCPDRNKLVGCLPGDDALVVSNAPVPVKSSFNTPVGFVGICHFCQDPDHDLSGKLKAIPKVIVKKMVQIILAKDLSLPCMVTDIIGGIVHAFQRLQQRLVLLFSRCQFNLSYQFHKYIITYTSRLDNKEGWRIPLPAKAGSLLRQRL